MSTIPRWAWVVIALVGLYLLWRFAGSSTGQSYGPIKVVYDKIGQARDKLGVPFTQMNPGR